MPTSPTAFPTLLVLLPQNEVRYVIKDIPPGICWLSLQSHLAILDNEEPLRMCPVSGHEWVGDVVHHHVELVVVLLNETASNSNAILYSLVLGDLYVPAERPLVLSVSLGQIDGEEKGFPLQLCLK